MDNSPRRSQAVASSLQTELRAEIDSRYVAAEHSRGWRMFYSDPSAFETGSVLLVGFNPGGNEPEWDRDRDRDRDGFVARQFAYRYESWGGRAPGRSQLQQQVLALLESLGLEDHEVLAGNLVPFRSPSASDLHDAARSVGFGRDIWRRVLAEWVPRLVIALGEHTAQEFAGLLSGTSATESYVPGTPNGRYRCTRWNYAGGRLVHLPHLSRCRIIREGVEPVEVKALFSR